MKTLHTIYSAVGVALVIICLGWASVGFTAELTLMNDSFSGSGSVFCVSGQSFAEGEIAAARFTADASSYPFQILRVQVLACPSGTQADLVLKIWEDDGVSDEPGNLLYEDFFTLLGSDNALNELDVSFQDINVQSGSIRVGIQYFFGPALTGFATDLDGHGDPQPNFIYAINPPGWYPAHFWGVNGDWIIRVVVDANEQPPVFVDGFESGDAGAWSDVLP